MQLFKYIKNEAGQLGLFKMWKVDDYSANLDCANDQFKQMNTKRISHT